MVVLPFLLARRFFGCSAILALSLLVVIRMCLFVKLSSLGCSAFLCARRYTKFGRSRGCFAGSDLCLVFFLSTLHCRVSPWGMWIRSVWHTSMDGAVATPG